MRSSNRLAAAAVIAALLIGGAALFFGLGERRTDTIGAPSPSPTATSSASSPSTSSAPSASLAGTIGVGVPAQGTIVFGRHDASTKTTTLKAIGPRGGTELTLEQKDACCLSLATDGSSFAYAIDIGGRLTPAVRSLDAKGFELMTWPGTGPNGTIDSSRLNLAPGAMSQRGDIAFDGWDNTDPSRTGLYVSEENGGGLIMGVLKRLTTNPGTLHDVPIGYSRDGSKLLFVRDQDPGEGVSGDLYVMAADGTGLRRLNPASARVPLSDSFGAGASWSPDGQRVAFAGFDSTKTDGTSSIYVADVATGSAAAITGLGIYSTSARWSPDGTWIAFDRLIDPVHHDIFLVHPDGTGLKDITSALDVGVCCGQWSPDSHWIVVQGSLTGRDDQADLLIVSAVDGTYARLTQSPSDYLNWVAWSSTPAPTTTP